jgi:hypothetical protein
MGSCIYNVQRQDVMPIETPRPTGTLEKSVTNTSAVSDHPKMTSTNLSSPTTEITWTPLPTINPKYIDSFVESMKSKCELPCWGGITPGRTSEMEAKHIVSSFGTLIESTSVYFEYHQNPAVIDFMYDDGIVSGINLPPQLTESEKLNNLLSRFGIPEDIRVEVIPETADGTPWFFLTVFYPSQGVLAVFSAEAKIINSKINVCFEKALPDLYLVDPNNSSLSQMSNLLDPTLASMLKPLENLAEINREQFYELYSTSDNRCMATKVPMP